jgi:hypothetical protein
MSALSSAKLFGRSVSLTVGVPNDPTLDVKAQFNDTNSHGLDVSGLDMEFIVEKSLKATEFNTCAIKVFNLGASDRQALSGDHSLSVKLEAGYLEGTAQLYFAGARSAWTTREHADFVTHIESTDTIARPLGVKSTKKIPPGSQTGSVYRTTGARVPLAQAFQTIAQAMGIAEGNLQQALAKGGFPIAAVNGAALLGNGARRMTDLCRSAGLEWSIQDGALQLLNIGATLSTTKAIEISDTTGLIESPSVDSQGALSLTTLLIPGLAPGVLLKVDSLFVSGGYRIEKIRYSGSTRGQEWYAHIEAAKY